MPVARKHPDERRRSVGVSLDGITISRLDALAGDPGRRSELVNKVLDAGLSSLFGPRWREIADVMRGRESAADIEVLVVERELEAVAL